MVVSRAPGSQYEGKLTVQTQQARTRLDLYWQQTAQVEVGHGTLVQTSQLAGSTDGRSQQEDQLS